MLTALFFMAAPVFAVTIPKPTEAFYVNDYADVISESSEFYIIEKNDALYASCGAQIVIVTVSGLGGENIERYALSIFNEWEIGSADKNNGVLFLISVADEDYWALQGRGLEDTLSSGILAGYLDEYVEKPFAAGDYDGAALAFFDSVYENLIGQYGRPNAVNEGSDGEYTPSFFGLIRGILRFFGTTGIIIIIIIISVLRSLPRRFGGFYRRPRFFPPFFFGGRGGRGGPGGFGGFGGSGGSGGSGGAGRSRGGGGGSRGGGGSSRGGGAGRGRR